MSEQTNDTSHENQGQGTATETDTLGEGGKKALDAERKARKELEKQLAEAQERISQFEDANRTELERVEARASAAEAAAETMKQQLAAAERARMVAEVAGEVGLPAEFHDRLRGEDRDEILADAKELQKFLAPEGPRKPSPVPEAGASGEVSQSTDQAFADFFQQNFN